MREPQRGWMQRCDDLAAHLHDRLTLRRHDPNRPGRRHFPRQYDADRNRVPDAVGYWNMFASFRANQRYRVGMRVSRTPDTQNPGSGCYVKLVSDRTGYQALCHFQFDGTYLVGSITTGPSDDYRLVLGMDPGTSVEVFDLWLAAEGRPFGFATNAERRSWRYGGRCRPTSWGVRGPSSFGGVVAGWTGHPPTNPVMGSRRC